MQIYNVEIIIWYDKLLLYYLYIGLTALDLHNHDVFIYSHNGNNYRNIHFDPS